MFNEYKFFRRMDLDDLAAYEEARRHAPLARMIRVALAGSGPRQQLTLFPNSNRPVVKEAP